MCKVIDEYEQRGIQNGVDLINYLWSHGRGEEALRAGHDEALFKKLLAEYQAATSVTRSGSIRTAMESAIRSSTVIPSSR